MVKSRAKTSLPGVAPTDAADEPLEFAPEAVADDNVVEETGDETNLVATVAVVGVVAIGVAVVEAALLPGVILGVAAMAAPKIAPKLGSALSSMFKHSVRGVYRLNRKTRDLFAETREQVEDICAEVDSEAQTASIAEEAKEGLQ